MLATIKAVKNKYHNYLLSSAGKGVLLICFDKDYCESIVLTKDCFMYCHNHNKQRELFTDERAVIKACIERPLL